MKEQNKGISNNISHVFTQVRILELWDWKRSQNKKSQLIFKYTQIEQTNNNKKRDKKSQFILKINDLQFPSKIWTWEYKKQTQIGKQKQKNNVIFVLQTWHMGVSQILTLQDKDSLFFQQILFLLLYKLNKTFTYVMSVCSNDKLKYNTSHILKTQFVNVFVIWTCCYM
jgi:hypothetical protein